MLLTYSRSTSSAKTLLTMRNADRRGAPDTFDNEALAQAVARCKQGGRGGEEKLPGFDHAKVRGIVSLSSLLSPFPLSPSSLPLFPSSLSPSPPSPPLPPLPLPSPSPLSPLPSPPLTREAKQGDPEPGAVVVDTSKVEVVVWEGLYLFLFPDVCRQLDLGVYIESDLETCMAALKVRNLVLPGYSKEEILKRVDVVDRANAIAVNEHAQRLLAGRGREGAGSVEEGGGGGGGGGGEGGGGGGRDAAEAQAAVASRAAATTTAPGATTTTASPPHLLVVKGWSLE